MQDSTIKLFQFIGTDGHWEFISNDARINFYNANEDAAKKDPEWHLEVEGAQEAPDVLIDDTFEFQINELRCVFVGADSVWGLQFPTTTSFASFSQQYNNAVFANTFKIEKTEASELKIFGADFIKAFGRETEASRDAWVEDMDIDEKPQHEELLKTARKDKLIAERSEAIQSILMGAGDRSYVVRENGIDVFRNIVGGLEDAEISFKFTPPPSLVIPDGPSPSSGRRTPGSRVSATPGRTPGSATSLTPSRALLMDRETRMNMLTPGSSSLYHADIETGKIVREYAFEKDGVEVPMKDISADTKASQLETRDTFLSLDTNRLARWDMRAPSGIVQEMSSPAALEYIGGRDYSRGTKFSCMATSGAGYVVVGSDDGKIRLYSEKTLTQAKTAIPGLGAPITSVDVTYDGRWVLATTKSYLMVVKTTYKDGESGKEVCGFTSRIGAKAPAPRLLRLAPKDLAVTGGAPLEKAHFTWITEAGRQERWIVASCGKYTVLWNFRSVKIAAPDVVSLGGLTTITTYNMIPKNEHVVDSVFMHENYAKGHGNAAENIVIVTDKKVYNIEEEDEEEEGNGSGRMRQPFF